MARRNELLAALADHVLAHGIGELSLRPLAAAAGTNARMLLYHFRSKEELVEAVLGECARRRGDVLAGAPAGAFLGVWNSISSRRAEPHMRLALEIESLAATGRQEFGRAAKQIGGEWLGLFPGTRRKQLATAAAAAARGLLLDLYSSGERTRINAAAHDLSGILERAK
jgi:AcrR family transcriptional regulator